MYTLTVELTAFQAVRDARDIDTIPSHRVFVMLAAEQLDERGFIREVYGMEELGIRIQQSLQRRHSRMEADVLAEENPTVETLAKYVYDMVKEEIPECVAVGISEPPGMLGMYSEATSFPPVLFL